MKKVDALLIKGNEVKKVMEDEKFKDYTKPIMYKKYVLIGELDKRLIFLEIGKDMK